MCDELRFVFHDADTAFNADINPAPCTGSIFDNYDTIVDPTPDNKAPNDKIVDVKGDASIVIVNKENADIEPDFQTSSDGVGDNSMEIVHQRNEDEEKRKLVKIFQTYSNFQEQKTWCMISHDSNHDNDEDNDDEFDDSDDDGDDEEAVDDNTLSKRNHELYRNII